MGQRHVSGDGVRELRSIISSYVPLSPRFVMCSPGMTIGQRGRRVEVVNKLECSVNWVALSGIRVNELHRPTWGITIEQKPGNHITEICVGVSPVDNIRVLANLVVGVVSQDARTQFDFRCNLSLGSIYYSVGGHDQEYELASGICNLKDFYPYVQLRNTNYHTTTIATFHAHFK